MKLKITKTNGGFSIELPEGAGVGEGEAEAFESESGAIIIVAKRKEGEMPQEGAAAKENALLKKLSSIKFEERTPQKVDGELSPQELSVLAGLLKKKLVNVFYGKKYAKTGVYSISSNAFAKAMQVENAHGKADAAQPAAPVAQNPLAAQLEKEGFLAIENEQQVRLLASLLQQRIAAGEIIGVRGFDRKYYMATRKFYSQNMQKIEGLLSKPKSAQEIAAQGGIEQQAAVALLNIMCEQGDAIEKKRGLFERA